MRDNTRCMNFTKSTSWKKAFPFPIPSGTYALNFFHSATQMYRLRQKQFLFSSVQDGIYVLGKAHALHPVSQTFSQHCLWSSFNVRLTDDGPFSSFQGRSSSASSFHASLFQMIGGVMSLALAGSLFLLNTFRSSETQSSCGSCFSRQSICSVISLHSGMSKAVHPQEFLKVDVNHRRIPISTHRNKC